MRIDIDTFNVHSAQVLGSPMLLERGSFDETAAKGGVHKLRWQDEVGKVVLEMSTVSRFSIKQ